MDNKIIIFITIILFIPLMAFAARYNNNGNGTVADNVTGLMWQQEDDNTSRLWEAAITYCESLSFATYSDWRLPNIKELRSIVDNSRYNPSIDASYFPNTNLSYYWSSTTHALYSSSAWYVSFGSGLIYYGSYESYSLYVRCVRGG